MREMVIHNVRRWSGDFRQRKTGEISSRRHRRWLAQKGGLARITSTCFAAEGVVLGLEPVEAMPVWHVEAVEDKIG